MPYCLNPVCPQPDRPGSGEACQHCYTPLVLQNRYVALCVIGQGGFGKTLLAEDGGKPSKPRCVIKVFAPQGQGDLAKASELFHQEADRLDDLGHHDQIPELLAYAEQGNTQYIVQQFIPGLNLKDEVSRQGLWSVEQLRDLFLDLLPVLQFCHDRSVIHRDIKPQNIIRRATDNKLVLVDFGAAKYATSETQLVAYTQTGVGSAEFAAPEQVKRRTTYASDLYSLGVTGLHLLTGASPWDLESEENFGQWQWRSFVQAQGTVLDPKLADFIDRLIAKSLSDRFRSATEALAVLAPHLVPAKPIDLTAVVVEPPKLDRSQELALTASECQTGVKKTIVLESGKRLEVTLPAGVQVGQRLRLQGYGATDSVTGAVGDLYLVVQEANPPLTPPRRGTGTPPLPTPSVSPVQGLPTRPIRDNLNNQTFDLPNNGGKLELIAVPGGTLVMEGGHRVNLQPFLIGKYPVTQRQYQAVIGKNPSYFKGGFFGRLNLDDHPVEQVSWHKAIDFCKKLSEILKQTIDLPSETQWEWAARGATKSKGFEYAGSNNLDEVGWYGQNSGGKTHPVGQKNPNELGLYDMSGNVWEWCKDVWSSDSNVLPGDGTPLNAGDSSYHAVRGGSWNNNSSNCRCARRNRNNYWYDNQGFRVVLLDLSGVSGVSL